MKFDFAHPWDSCTHDWTPFSNAFQEFPHFFTRRHYRVFQAFFSFRNLKNKTCYPPPDYVAARAGMLLSDKKKPQPQFYIIAKELVDLWQMTTEKGSVYYKYPNHRFPCVDYEKADKELIRMWLGSLEQLPPKEATKLPRKEVNERILKIGSSNFLLRKWRLLRAEVGQKPQRPYRQGKLLILTGI